MSPSLEKGVREEPQFGAGSNWTRQILQDLTLWRKEEWGCFDPGLSGTCPSPSVGFGPAAQGSRHLAICCLAICMHATCSVEKSPSVFCSDRGSSSNWAQSPPLFSAQ